MKTRAVSVCIPVRRKEDGNGVEALVVSSRRHDDRGGVEPGETSAAAGTREAWEEAGIRGTVVKTIAEDIPGLKGHKTDASVPKCKYTVHIFRVDKVEADWPEKEERQRKWCSLADAFELVSWREEMRQGGRAALPSEADIQALLV